MRDVFSNEEVDPEFNRYLIEHTSLFLSHAREGGKPLPLTERAEKEREKLKDINQRLQQTAYAVGSPRKS